VAYVKKMWWTYTSNDDPMLKVLVEAGENPESLEEYDGLPMWENMALTASAKFKWAPFLEWAGLTIRDVKTKTIVEDQDDPNMGAPITKIADFEPGSDESWLRVVVARERYNGNWSAHVKEWLPYDEAGADEEDEELDEDDLDEDEADEEEEDFEEQADDDDDEDEEEEPPPPPARASARRGSSAGRSAAAAKPAAKTPAKAAATKTAATRSARSAPAKAPATARGARTARTATTATKTTTKPARGGRRSKADEEEPPF
jgi:hypothetical protein